MFTVSLLGKGDRFRSSGYNAWNVFLPIWRIPAPHGSKYTSGVEPIQGGKNSFGDNECLHFNLKGSIHLAPLGYYSKLPYTTINFRPSRDSSKTVSLAVYLLALSGSGNVYGTHIIDVGDDFNQSFYTDWYEDPWTQPLRTKRSMSVTWEGLVAEIRSTLEMYQPSTGLTSYSIQVSRYEMNTEFTRHRSTPFVTYSSPDRIINWVDYPFGSWIDFGWYDSCVSKKDGLPQEVRFDAPTLWDRVKKLLGDDLYSQNRFIWGDLAQDAADNTRRLDINTPAYIADFFKVKDLVKSLMGLARGRITAKKIASAYLSVHYGVELTLKDTQEISEALQRTLIMVDEMPFQVARSRASESFVLTHGTGGIPLQGERKYNFKLYYNPIDDGFLNAVRSMMTWDVFPTLANVWDYIPFSFVVDWFLKVEDQLERFDHNTYISTLRVMSCLMTTRLQVTIPSETLLGFIPGGMTVGDFTVVYYDRTISPTAPLPISRFDLPRSFNHWIEGAALFLQRR